MVILFCVVDYTESISCDFEEHMCGYNLARRNTGAHWEIKHVGTVSLGNQTRLYDITGKSNMSVRYDRAMKHVSTQICNLNYLESDSKKYIFFVFFVLHKCKRRTARGVTCPSITCPGAGGGGIP